MGRQELILSEILKELNSVWLFGGGGGGRGHVVQVMVGRAGRDAEPESSSKTPIFYA